VTGALDPRTPVLVGVGTACDDAEASELMCRATEAALADAGGSGLGAAVDRVAVGPPGNCGECHNCLQGRASICVNGCLRRIENEDGAVAAISAVSLSSNWPSVARAAHRLKEAIASLASTAPPSLNFNPGRRVKCQVRPSALLDHVSIICGRGVNPLSVTQRWRWPLCR